MAHLAWRLLFCFPRDGIVGHERNRYYECLRTIYIISIIYKFTVVYAGNVTV